MRLARLLYIDVPFEHGAGGDKNRSRFLWQALRLRFDVDLLLVVDDRPTRAPAWIEYVPIATLLPQTPPLLNPAGIPTFAPHDLERFREVLRVGAYDAVLARFYTSWELLKRVAQFSPRTPIVVDVDMLGSRLAALSWNANRSVERRWHLIQSRRLRAFEHRLFGRPWLFLFTNPVELAAVAARSGGRAAKPEFALLPNPMPSAPKELPRPHSRIVLFFGCMDSAANGDAFMYLMDEILPRIEATLHRHDAVIQVVGRAPGTQLHRRLAESGTKRVQIVGEVESMHEAIARSLFVLLPLRIASGTRTRILEAAALKRAVITTPIGAEGLDLGGSVLIGRSAAELCVHVEKLLVDSERADRLGARLFKQAVARYTPERVSADLVQLVRSRLG